MNSTDERIKKIIDSRDQLNCEIKNLEKTLSQFALESTYFEIPRKNGDIILAWNRLKKRIIVEFYHETKEMREARPIIECPLYIRQTIKPYLKEFLEKAILDNE